MFNKIKNLSFVLSVLVLSFSLGYLAIAWSEPSQTPPDGGTAAPLNVSINAQAKEGALIVGANSAVETGLIVQYGKVGIGTTDPQAELHVNGNVIASAPVSDTHLATKGYVDASTGSGGAMTISCGWITTGTPPGVGSCTPTTCPSGYETTAVSCVVNALTSTPPGFTSNVSQIFVPSSWYQVYRPGYTDQHGSGGAGGYCYRTCYK
jgi:hypothetical protein